MPYTNITEQRKAQAEWARRNGEETNYHRAEYVRKNGEWIRQLKESTPCADCGGFYAFCCMHFDHLPGAAKVGNIGEMVTENRNRITLRVISYPPISGCPLGGAGSPKPSEQGSIP
jgi:hypothetical protein